MRDLIASRWSEIEPLLDALLELAPELRAAELERRCHDPELRAAASQLLAFDASHDSGVDQLAREISAHAGGLEGQRIGPYLIERALGEGGMGAVFLATRQTAEFTQQVALKLLRVGLFSAAQQEQFRREQRIHARLEHPHIARVFDSGISAAGVPYFAMEYVDGVPVTDYCDAARLGVDARLRLFAMICDAVAYSHLNLIVHRDLKPSNILVDRDGEPKLLDFGIAKLLGDSPENTRTGLRQLTPDYAAPEQSAGGAITTATDVYALGVLLCELLTGARPPRSDTGAVTAAITARVQPTTAAACGLSDKALRRRLRGDLDSIVRKAVQIEPERRYSGAAALAEDIRRHLDGRPIQARPDAAAYRLGKFIQRHKVGFAASLALIATLIGASVFSLQQARRARAAAALAEAASAKSDAEKRFLLNLFVGTNPSVATAVETPEQMLAYGRQRVARDFPDQPELQVEVLGTIGDVERQRGRFAESHAALEQAADIAHERLGAGDARTLNAELLLIRLDLVQSKYASASNRLNRAVAAFRASNQGDSEVLSEAIEDQARLRMALGDDAVALASDALTMARRLPRAEGEDQISHALQTFGDALTRAGRPAEAIAPLDEARAYISSKVGNQHAFVAMVHRLTATAEAELGHLDRADELSQQAVAIYRQVYKRPFANFALALNERADILLRLARWDDGIALGEEALAMQRKLFTDAHASIASTLTILGSARYRQQRYADAESLQREALAIALQTLGAEHPTVARIQRELGLTLAALGRHDEAAQLVALATASDHKRFGDSHVQIANDLLIAAELAVARGESNSAATKASTAVAMFERELPPHSSKLLTARLDAGRVLLAAHDFAQAEPMFDAAVADARTGTPVVALYLAQAFAGLGDAQAGQDHVDSARASWQTALKTLARAPEADATVAEKLARQLKTSSR